jgi:hypothetical protein
MRRSGVRLPKAAPAFCVAPADGLQLFRLIGDTPWTVAGPTLRLPYRSVIRSPRGVQRCGVIRGSAFSPGVLSAPRWIATHGGQEPDDVVGTSPCERPPRATMSVVVHRQVVRPA